MAVGAAVGAIGLVAVVVVDRIVLVASVSGTRYIEINCSIIHTGWWLIVVLLLVWLAIALVWIVLLALVRHGLEINAIEIKW